MPPDEMTSTYRRYLAAVVRFHLAAADMSGLGHTDYQASNLLDLDGPMTSGELAARLRITPSAATRAVDRLVEAGLAERTTDPEDRRRTVVRHTGRLPAPLVELLGRTREPIGRAVGALTEEQRAGLLSYFRAATEAYQGAVGFSGSTGQQSTAGSTPGAPPPNPAALRP
ncbi:MarR family winged helix-turn-helix transcriptional regulator, partial [Actinoalloteichus spitiensis]|uniref:MarR family winged helix-turn-helix transcriptional regulator n=1 Tax=Actinoalloteichus spitiensis TaxID=252394 RepID=UPI00146E6DD6